MINWATISYSQHLFAASAMGRLGATCAAAAGFLVGILALRWISARPASTPAADAVHSAPTVGPFNLDRRKGLRAAVAARAVRDEIVTYTSNKKGLSAAANMALQLQRLGITQHLVLADARSTCIAGHARWPWLGCGWSHGLDGFEAKYAAGYGGETTKLWSLWSAKWLLVARLVELRVNVLALDTDMLVQTNPYPLLHSPPISRFTMVIVPEGSRVNLGFIYVRGRDCKRGGGVTSVLWDVVRRLRLFTEDWTLLGRRGRKSSTAGLWDQGIFTDAISSAVAGELIYPYTYLQSPRTGVWAAIGWPPAHMTTANVSRLHVVPWHDARPRGADREAITRAARRHGVPWHAERPAAFLPPPGHPQRAQWESKRHPLLWTAVRPLDPVAQLAERRPSAVTPGWLDGRLRPMARGVWPTGATRARDDAAETILATPDWLYCIVGRWAVTAGWPSLAPRAVCAVLHLVECRSQFGDIDANKHLRPYVQRALGYWHLREPPPAPLLPLAAPDSSGAARAIRLPAIEWAGCGESEGIGALLNALSRLALYAAVTGRTPVIPRVPCTSKWIMRNPFGRAGLADDYVLQLPNRSHADAGAAVDAAAIECHLALGGQRCMLPTVLPAWIRPESASLAFLGNRTPELAPAAQATAHLRSHLRAGADGAGARGAAARAFERDVSRPRRGGGTPRGRRQQCQPGDGRRLGLDVAALRAAASGLAHAPMLEVASLVGFGGAAAGGAPPTAGESRRGCQSIDHLEVEIDHLEAELLPAERQRLRTLRDACPGFFAPRGGHAGELDWLHRRRKL